MKIDLETFDPSWADEYKQLENDLKPALSHLKCHHAHIGSTSIPGLVAKPIIDILIGIDTTEHFDLVIQPLLDLGYIYIEKFKTLLPERLFFIKLKDLPEDIVPLRVYKESDEIPVALHPYKCAQIHVVRYQSYNWQRHIAFRDYLKVHPSIRDAYAALKIDLSKKEWKDSPEYTAAKDQFILETEKASLEWMLGKPKL